MPIQGIRGIPLELRCAILRQLPTVEDLFSAIQSTALFYAALKEDRFIVGCVLSTQIDARLLPFVAAFLEYDKSGSTEDDFEPTAPKILPKCLSETPSQAKQQLAQITLREALHALDRHKYIQYFANRYAAKALTILRQENVFDTPVIAFSPSEMHRIERSLYVFELYCFLYGHPDWDMDDLSEREAFFRQFAPWEHEQLACVHYFLLSEFRPVFTEVASHHIEFAQFPMYWVGEDYDLTWLHGFLVLGLELLKQVTTASTYEEWVPLFNKHLGLVTSFPTLHSWLLDPDFNAIPYPPLQTLDDETMAQLREGPNLFSRWDPDYGPPEIWFQAHKGHSNSQWFLQYFHRASREVAYVMMDISRKDGIARFDGPRKSAMLLSVDEVENFSTDTYKEQVKSCKIRRRIYKKGGRGWWSETDSSRIRWDSSKARRG